MAILPARDKPEGIHHFGFQVEKIEDTFHTAKEAGAKEEIEEKPRDGRFAEVGIRDPSGQKIDLSVQGWKT